MSESTELLEQYERRRLSMLEARDEIALDLKELDAEMKAQGLNVPEARKWVDAKHKDKLPKKVADTVDSVRYGEALGHDLGISPNNREGQNCDVRNGSSLGEG